MNKIFLLLGIVFIMCINFSLATEDAIITYSPSQEVYISNFCSTSLGNPCTNAYNCEITIYNPDWTLNYSNLAMNYVSNGFFNVSLGTYPIEGDYKGFIICNSTEETNNATTRSDFRISKYTNENIMGDNTMIAVTLLMLFLIIGLITFSMKTKLFFKEEPMQKFFSFVSSSLGIFLIVVLLGIFVQATQGEVYNPIMESIYAVMIYIVMAYLLVTIIINLWSFVPYLVKKGFSWVGNQ